MSLKNVSISGKDDISALAYEAHNSTRFSKFVDSDSPLVNVVSVVAGKADQSSITESSFKEGVSHV